MTVSPPPTPTGFAKGVADYLDHYITVADAKAGLLLGADVALATLLLNNLQSGANSPLASWGAVLLYGASGLVGTAALWPRLPSAGRSLVFWEDIYRRSPDDYRQAVAGLDQAGAEAQYVDQAYFLSRVLHAKHVLIRVSMGLLILGTLAAAASRVLR